MWKVNNQTIAQERKKFLPFFILSFILLFTSCKTTKQTISQTTSGNLKNTYELFKLIQDQKIQYQTLSARLNVDINLPDNNMSSRVDLKMVKDSVFQLSVQPLLGIEIFRIQLSVDSVKAIDRLHKRYVADQYSNLKGQTAIDFNFYNLQALLTNQLFYPGQKNITSKQFYNCKLKQENSKVEIQTKDVMDLLYAFLVDNEEKLLSTQISTQENGYVMQWGYSDFQIFDKKLFPMRMNIQLNKQGTSKGNISMNFSRLQTNTPLQMEFYIPPKYERITLNQIIKSLSNNKVQ